MRGGRQRSPSARCLLEQINQMWAFAFGCRSSHFCPQQTHSLFLSVCVSLYPKKQPHKTYKTLVPFSWGKCRWAHFLPQLGASQHFANQMTLVRACSWQHNQTHCQQLKRHFLWVIACCDIKRSCCAIWRGSEWVQKANELAVFSLLPLLNIGA